MGGADGHDQGGRAGAAPAARLRRGHRRDRRLGRRARRDRARPARRDRPDRLRRRRGHRRRRWSSGPGCWSASAATAPCCAPCAWSRAARRRCSGSTSAGSASSPRSTCPTCRPRCPRSTSTGSPSSRGRRCAPCCRAARRCRRSTTSRWSGCPATGWPRSASTVEGSNFVNYAADAVIVATPTGSTAYSFSAGGPIVSPNVEGLIVSASAAHSSFNRSLMLSLDEQLELDVLPDQRPAGGRGGRHHRGLRRRPATSSPIVPVPGRRPGHPARPAPRSTSGPGASCGSRAARRSASATPADATVVDSFEQSRYEILLGGEVAGVLHYRRHGGAVELAHTEIDQAFEGRGLAGRLASAALDDARARATPVRVTCPFVAGYLERHPEYADLLAIGGPRMTSPVCAHLDQVDDVTPSGNGCVECLADGRPLGAPAPLHDLRPRRLLRLLAQQARDRALPRRRPPARAVVRAGRELVVVLPGQRGLRSRERALVLASAEVDHGPSRDPDRRRRPLRLPRHRPRPAAPVRRDVPDHPRVRRPPRRWTRSRRSSCAAAGWPSCWPTTGCRR